MLVVGHLSNKNNVNTIGNARPTLLHISSREPVLTLIAVIANGTLYIDGGSATFINVDSSGNQRGNITDGFSKFSLEFFFLSLSI